MDYVNSKTPSMYCSLGSTTLSQLAFSREKRPEFLMGEVAMGQYSRKTNYMYEQSYGFKIHQQYRCHEEKLKISIIFVVVVVIIIIIIVIIISSSSSIRPPSLSTSFCLPSPNPRGSRVS